MIDVRTNAGLREALLDLPDPHSWSTPLGRQVIDAIAVRARAAAFRFGRCGDTPVPDLAESLVGFGWELMLTQREQVIAAAKPWGLVHQAMARHARAESHAADLLTSNARARRALKSAGHTALRIGDHQVPDPGQVVDSPALAAGTGGWDEGLRALHRELVAAGAEPGPAREAIASGLDMLNRTTRRSHLHMLAYRDDRLIGMLGRPGVTALMNLLIGSRREGPAGSAWLALRDAARAGRRPDLDATHPHSIPRIRTVANQLTSA